MVYLNPFTTPNGLIFSPFFIFIEGGQEFTDRDLLTRFGHSSDMTLIDRSELFEMDSGQTWERIGGWRRSAVIAETALWKLIADDWLYTLWHRHTTKSVILDLATRHNMLVFSTGDIDHSYDLRYFRNGNLIREWIVDDILTGPDQGQRLLVDDGEPLAGERGLQNPTGPYLEEVAAANGFDVAEAIDSARMWVGEPPEERTHTATDETERRTRSWRR